MLLRQEAFWQPDPVTRLLDKTAQCAPGIGFAKAERMCVFPAPGTAAMPRRPPV